MQAVKAFGKSRIPGIKFGRKAGVTLASPPDGLLVPETPKALQIRPGELKLDARPLLERRKLDLQSREVDLINGFGNVPEWSRIAPLPLGEKGAKAL